MATITQRNGYHVLNFTTEAGERRHISLGKVGTVPQRDLDTILRTKEYELSTGARLLNVHRRPAPRFDSFAIDYLLWHKGEYPDSHYRTAQIVEDHLLPHFGATPLNLITVQQGEDYKTKRRFVVAPNTVGKEWRVLAALINRAVRIKVIQENPLAAVKPPKALNSKPHHYYQTDELAKLYAASKYGPYWRLLANTGMRRGEFMILRWLWITDAVRIQSTGEERTKDGEWRKIPLTEGVKLALAEIKQDGPYVAPRMAKESLSRAFARDAQACGLPGSMHCLRHSFICHLLLNGVPMRTAQLYAGHAHISTTEKYAYQVLQSDPAAALNMAI